MKRTIHVPFPVSTVYSALMNPMHLSEWLGAPSVTLGEDAYHVFEIEDWRGEDAFRVRGTVLEYVPEQSILIELDPVLHDSTETLRLSLASKGDSTRLDADWEVQAYTPFIDRLDNPAGFERLRAALATGAVPFPPDF